MFQSIKGVHGQVAECLRLIMSIEIQYQINSIENLLILVWFILCQKATSQPLNKETKSGMLD